MARWLVVAALLTGLMCCASRHVGFGDSLTIPPGEAVPVARVLEHPDEFAGRRLLVSGRVDSVCAKKGCWLRLTDEPGAETVFVKFTCPVGGRLIPMEAVGHQALVEGVLAVEEISQEDARHYQEDAGASAEEIAKIVGPQKQLSISAPAARIKGLRKDA